MKSLFLSLLTLLVALPAFAEPPTVTVQTASTVTTNTGIIRGVVNANGSNTVAWFSWGKTTDIGTLTAAGSIGDGSTNYSVNATLTGLLSGTRYFYSILASNETSQISTSAVESFVTIQVGYSYTGGGFTPIDENRPLGSEPGSVWDDALRQTKQAMKNWIENEHELPGEHKDDFLLNSMIPDNTITSNKFETSTLAWLTGLGAATNTNAVVSVLVTNAMTYITHRSETTPTDKDPDSGGVILGSINISSNTFRYILVTAECAVFNNRSDKALITLLLIRNGVEFGLSVRGEYNVSGFRDMLFSPSWMIAGGQTETLVYSLIMKSGTAEPKANTTGRGYTLRAWGVP